MLIRWRKKWSPRLLYWNIINLIFGLILLGLGIVTGAVILLEKGYTK